MCLGLKRNDSVGLAGFDWSDLRDRTCDRDLGGSLTYTREVPL